MMNSMVVLLQDISADPQRFGNKTVFLKKCVDWGYTVPPFVAIEASYGEILLGSSQTRLQVAQEISVLLPVSRYAVRSSTLVEDSTHASFAGQFHTRTNVTVDELPQVMEDVLQQAKHVLQKSDSCSLLIQEYISPEIFGVTFTRNLSGGREMMVECGSYDGPQVVGGEVRPDRLSFLWNVPMQKMGTLNTEMIRTWKELEERSGFPQDIEWCVRDNQMYILQMRPITTVSLSQYKQILFLEQTLSSDNHYFFEKTEISEIVSRPVSVVYDLLQRIYAAGGPVDRVYRTHHVEYTSTDFLRIIGNELFVDKEQELRGLLPAYTYKEMKPVFSDYRLAWTTIKNLFFLNTIKVDGYDTYFDRVKNTIEVKNIQKCTTLASALNVFLDEYETIFEINLLSGIATKQLEVFLKKEPITAAEILGSGCFFERATYAIVPPVGLVGNSLDLSDTSVFQAATFSSSGVDKKVAEWWQSLPSYKKKLFQKKIVEATVWSLLREYGRWQTVIGVNHLRQMVYAVAAEQGLTDTTLAYFVPLADLLSGSIDVVQAQNRQKMFMSYADFELPAMITSWVNSSDASVIGVSAGQTSGILLTSDMVSAYSGNEPVILYTDILSPDLTQYFDRISGIVSCKGGLLSHLAIVARERGLPVIVGVSLSQNTIRIGDTISIDGSSGSII